jgi:hypothetical protein
MRGTLKISKENAIDLDYKMKLVELLKNHSKAGIFDEIRQLIANAEFSNYGDLYKYLFDKVDDYAKKKAPIVIILLAEGIYQSSLVFEREITMCAVLHKILIELQKIRFLSISGFV